MDSRGRDGVRYLRQHPEELSELLSELDLSHEVRKLCLLRLLTPELLVELLREVPLRQQTINLLYNSLRFQQYGFVFLRMSYKGLPRGTLNLEQLTDDQFRLLEEFTNGLMNTLSASGRFTQEELLKIRRERRRRDTGYGW